MHWFVLFTFVFDFWFDRTIAIQLQRNKRHILVSLSITGIWEGMDISDKYIIFSHHKIYNGQNWTGGMALWLCLFFVILSWIKSKNWGPKMLGNRENGGGYSPQKLIECKVKSSPTRSIILPYITPLFFIHLNASLKGNAYLHNRKQMFT